MKLRKFLSCTVLLFLFSLVPAAAARQTPIDVRQFVELKRFGKGAINDIAVNPSGELLAAAASTGVWIYNAATLGQVQWINSDVGSVWYVDWSPNGAYLAFGGSDGALRVWDTRTWQKVTAFKSPTSDWLSGLAWSQDSARLAFIGTKFHDAEQTFIDTLMVWDIHHGEPAVIVQSENPLKGILWMPGDTAVASHRYNSSDSGTTGLWIWDVSTGKGHLAIQTIQYISTDIRESPDGSLFAGGDYDGVVYVWDTSGNTITLRNDKSVWVEDMIWSSDGKRLTVGYEDGSIILWDVATQRHISTLSGHTREIVSLTSSADDKRLYSTSLDSTVRVWDAEAGQQLNVMQGHISSVTSLAWSPDGTQVASGNRDSSALVWDIASGQPTVEFREHASEVHDVAWSPDGQYLASASGELFGDGDNSLRIWDAASSKQHLKWSDYDAAVYSIAWSPDGRWIASGAGKVLSVRDALIGTLRFSTSDHSSSITSVAWSPDGKTLASSASVDMVRLWDAATGNALATSQETNITSLAWSPDSTRLVAGGNDHQVYILDARTGNTLQTLRGHEREVESVAWSRDGRYLASGSIDNTIRLWDAHTGSLLKILTGHQVSIQDLAWSPDGQYLASASWDGTVRIWGMPEDR